MLVWSQMTKHLSLHFAENIIIRISLPFYQSCFKHYGIYLSKFIKVKWDHIKTSTIKEKRRWKNSETAKEQEQWKPPGQEQDSKCRSYCSCHGPSSAKPNYYICLAITLRYISYRIISSEYSQCMVGHYCNGPQTKLQTCE